MSTPTLTRKDRISKPTRTAGPVSPPPIALQSSDSITAVRSERRDEKAESRSRISNSTRTAAPVSSPSAPLRSSGSLATVRHKTRDEKAESRGRISKPTRTAGPVSSLPTPPHSSDGLATVRNEIRDGNTGSAHSDEPSPSSTGGSAPSVPKLNLEEGYPSILSPIKLLRIAQSSGDVSSARALAKVFSTCLATIIRSMDRLPYDVRLDPVYEVAQCGVVFSGELFASQARKLKAPKPQPSFVVDSLAMTVHFMDMTVASLKELFAVAERIILENKPLPSLPEQDVVTEQHVELIVRSPSPDVEPPPLARIVVEVMEASTESAETASQLSHCTDSTSVADTDFLMVPNANGPSSPQIDIRSKGKKWHINSKQSKLIRRILQMTPSSSKLARSLRSRHSHRSSVTLVNAVEPGETFEAIPRPRLEDVPYELRQSAVYFSADPYCPEVDVEMPKLTGDTVAVTLDNEGTVKTASLTALVRMITSKDVLKLHWLADTFFFSFRYYTSPREVVRLLMERYNEEPVEGLNAAQLRVWTREAVSIRLRVASILILWLEKFWTPEFDSDALEQLQTFTLDRLAGKIPETLATRILEGLAVAAQGTDIRKVWREKHLKLVNSGTLVETPKAIRFDVRRDPQYDSPEGQEELARQLTLLAFDLYSELDPEEVVRASFHGKEQPQAQKNIVTWERSLNLLVTSVIMEQVEKKDKCRLLNVIGIWLNVASICVRLLNFSCGRAIFSGLTAAPISRLKMALLDIPIPHKEKYRALDELYSGHNNYGGYHRVLSEVHHANRPAETPFVPLLTPLMRNIETIGSLPGSKGKKECNKESVNVCQWRVIYTAVTSMEGAMLPYKFPQNESVRNWLLERLHKHHPTREAELNANFDKQSQAYVSTEWNKKHELTAHDTWLKVNVEGQLQDFWDPTVTSSKDSVRSKNHLAVFLNRGKKH